MVRQDLLYQDAEPITHPEVLFELPMYSVLLTPTLTASLRTLVIKKATVRKCVCCWV